MNDIYYVIGDHYNIDTSTLLNFLDENKIPYLFKTIHLISQKHLDIFHNTYPINKYPIIFFRKDNKTSFIGSSHELYEIETMII
tara:strand:+ start:17039 stop:17290 length:252 start_codon:yes stop_codon:yes gene_type:complete